MTSILEILSVTAWVSGGFLTILLLLSLIGGLELDFDLGGDSDVDSDAGLGVIKGILVFLTFGALVAKILIESEFSFFWAGIGGMAGGTVAGLFLSWVMKFLLQNQEEVNWHPEEAIGLQGKVYSRIHAGGSGIVRVVIRGSARELKACSEEAIPTGAQIEVVDLKDGLLQVEMLKKNEDSV
ncbi:MAG: hypothetical protein GYB31_01690 [Bacteroidetes bacterium]|nr:hypothetical protein [Bacteroidota bacterium]